MDENDNKKELQETDNNSVTSEQAPVSAQPAPLTPAEQKRQKKEAKRVRRLEKKARRKEKWNRLPGWRKVLAITLPILLLTVIAGLIVYFAAQQVIYDDSMERYENRFAPIDESIVLAEAPVDEEAAAKIDAMAGGDSEDTWSIYVYMIGSNLESNEENDLSELTQYLIKNQAAENLAENQALYRSEIETYISELSEQGMEAPSFFYYAEKPEASSTVVTDDVIVSEEQGMADHDINEMLDAELSENVQIVIQTGGATHWTSSRINPNRTQRFLISSDGFEEIGDLPLQDACSVETLTDYLSFCKRNYPADHTMVIFWDHGSGPFGYGSDEIYNTCFSLKDLNEALSNIYTANTENPPIDIIGFDACLMASAEAADALDGFSTYFLASEELEPGDGWYYTDWLTELSAHPEMNAAQLGKTITDSYVRSYVTCNQNVGDLVGEAAVCFSLLDTHQAKLTYDAYCDLMKEVLPKVLKNPAEIGTLSRAAARSVRYGQSSYDVVNVVDIGGFMDQLEDSYQAVADVRTQLRSAVIYSRANSYMRDSQGLSIYYPLELGSLSGLAYYTRYLDKVCDNNDMKALYYYKFGGCLNEELQDWCTEQKYGKAKLLDTTELSDLAVAQVTIQNASFSIPVSEDSVSLMQSYRLDVAVEEDDGSICYLGEDNYAYLDGEGNLCSDFDGKWVSVDGIPLALQLISESDSMITYRSAVLLNDLYAYLVIGFDQDTEEFTILGAVLPDSDYTNNNPGMRNVSELALGDMISPVYTFSMGDEEWEAAGDSFKYKESTVIEMTELPNGTYLEFFNITDPRCDSYSSPVVRFTMKNGIVTDVEVADDFEVLYEN